MKTRFAGPFGCMVRGSFVAIVLISIATAALLTSCREDRDHRVSINDANEDKWSEWLSKCVASLHDPHHGSKEVWFNGCGANDVVFLPQTNAVEEIIAQCQKVSPLSGSNLTAFREWLTARIGEMQQIRRGITREEAAKILEENGGLSNRESQIFSHKKCGCLKLRIEFKPTSQTNNHAFPYDPKDTVVRVSKPYLGLLICD